MNKARSQLGFIKPWSNEPDNPYVTKTVYMRLMSQLLKHVPVVWSPFYNLGRDPLVSMPTYKNRLFLLPLPLLQTRSLVHGISF